MHHRSTLLLLAGMLLAGCQAVQPQPLTTVPPANAQPGEVAASYLQALVDGDCAKARALTAPNSAAPLQPFCDHPRVTGFSELSPEGAAPNGTERVYAVQVTIRGGDISLPDGDHTMFLQVLLQPGGAWRVTGLGSGP